MRTFRRALLSIAVLGLAFASFPVAADPVAALDEPQRKAVEGGVRDYIKEHPEVVLEALDVLRRRAAAIEVENARKSLLANADALFRNASDPTAGNPQGDVTVVEFFDYQCGYCKSVQTDAVRLIEEDGGIRFVFKEYPILGPGSVFAAKAALASRAQGKYLEYHYALMGHRGKLDEATVFRLAKSVGLDVDRLRRDMESPEVAAALDANRSLGERIGVRGTPGFVIGEALVPGAIRLDEMRRLVKQARAAK